MAGHLFADGVASYQLLRTVLSCGHAGCIVGRSNTANGVSLAPNMFHGGGNAICPWEVTFSAQGLSYGMCSGPVSARVAVLVSVTHHLSVLSDTDNDDELMLDMSIPVPSNGARPMLQGAQLRFDSFLRVLRQVTFKVRKCVFMAASSCSSTGTHTHKKSAL